jgi:hypothetical protein
MAGVIKRKFWLMVVAFSLMGCGGEAFTFRLRNQQNSSEYSTLHTMPDGDLLVVAKRIEQPKQIWKLRRIAGWDGSQPRFVGPTSPRSVFPRGMMCVQTSIFLDG